ncbi:MAG: sigma-70 family RNA polymerase sigma factor [Spirochaetota bacterium]|nr:sigma-70 family RNA polymerase sigma factor [Spirochaetota bacterium]
MSKGRQNTQIPSHLEDKKLINDFQDDITIAFDKLVIKYKDKVFNLCYRLLGDYDEANDCAQETFIKVYKNLNKFKFKSTFSTWLYTITINTCKNRFSSLEYRNNKKIVRIDNPGRTKETVKSLEISDNSFNPETKLERKERKKVIQDAIDSLPQNQKILIILRDIEGKSYDEIVEITGLRLGTVKSKLARARHHLRGLLRGAI